MGWSTDVFWSSAGQRVLDIPEESLTNTFNETTSMRGWRLQTIRPNQRVTRSTITFSIRHVVCLRRRCSTDHRRIKKQKTDKVTWWKMPATFLHNKYEVELDFTIFPTCRDVFSVLVGSFHLSHVEFSGFLFLPDPSNTAVLRRCLTFKTLRTF